MGCAASQLADLVADWGTAVSCAGNQPVDLGDPQWVWFVEKGAVDLFLIERQDGVERAARQHALRARPGQLLPGVAPQAGPTTLGLIAKGSPETVLWRLPADRLTDIEPATVAARTDEWLTGISEMLVRDVQYAPRADALVDPGQFVERSEGTVSARRGVAWVSAPPAGSGLFLGVTDPVAEMPRARPGAQRPSAAGDPQESAPQSEVAGRFVALTPSSWLTLTGPVRLSACSTETLAKEGRLLAALADFYAVALSAERLNRMLAVVDQTNEERARVSSRRTAEDSARRRLLGVGGRSQEWDATAGDSVLLEALRIVGRHAGISFRMSEATELTNPVALLRYILDVSGVRGRRVRLVAEDRWWLGDSGAMLAFRAGDEQPVALLPGPLGRYREVDPVTGRCRPISAARAAEIGASAWAFHRPLPAGRVGLWKLLRFAGQGMLGDVARFVAPGVLGGLLMVLPAVMLGFVVADVIPAGSNGLLHTAAAMVAAGAIIGGLLHLLQQMALMRLEGRATSRVEAAFWDRLLRLPGRLLRRYPTGDLAMRGMTFQQLRDVLQNVVGNAFLSVVFLLPAYLVIYLYDAALGGVSLAFGILSLSVTLIFGLRQFAPQARVLRATHRVAAGLFQLLNGVSKLRAEGAEGSAFAAWAQDYRKQKEAELEVGALEAHLHGLGAALPLLAGAVLLTEATLTGAGTVTISDFLVVFAAFLGFQAAATRLNASFTSLAALRPALERVRPFLEESAAEDAEGEPVERLGGEILFDHISFSYDPDGPLVLDDVSMRVQPGEFVAIAGESGAGKSTLLRLALGLDQPSAGVVYYDGRDLRQLNARQLRRQLGVVPQDVRLQPVDILDNIAGAQEEEGAKDVWQSAWQAARVANVDRTIATMPMGMLTAVGISGAEASGGESQRITIAGALARNPRILLLDEATNWLDNDSQAAVMRNLADLSATRIIIAHRLSTLRLVDRIYVMQAGKVVQAGTFKELEATEGAFRDLVRRQMA